MAAALVVRPFAAHEWRLLRELRLRALAEAPDAFARTLAEEEGRADETWGRLLAESIASPAACSLVAERGGEPVGLAYGRLADEAPEVAHLYSMWVAPTARRAGVGRALVEAVAAWARGCDARRLVLGVTEGNTAAVRLYEATGFSATAEVTALRAGSPLRVRTMRRML
jgi:ribosomal protein S18 acetylase RimI-like enzyme